MTDTPSEAAPSAAPGWFPAADRPGQLRYWNGEVWTDDYIAPDAPQPATAPTPTKPNPKRDPPWKIALIVVLGLAVMFGGSMIWNQWNESSFDESDVKLKQLTCVNGDEVTGTIFNGTESTVDVTIEISYETRGRDLVDSTLSSVRGLRPGSTGDWDAYYPESRATVCRTKISRVFEK